MRSRRTFLFVHCRGSKERPPPFGMSLALFPFAALGLMDSLFPRTTLPLPASGQSISLFGTGPPCMFSSGLYGLMPRRLYTSLFTELMPRLTLVVLDDPRIVTRAAFEEAADVLGAERLALFSHSSLDAGILDSECLERAVLCDPVAMPRLLGLAPPLAAGGPTRSALVLRAGRAYDAPNAIPAFLSPANLDPVATPVRTFERMGHADLLDDTWASLGPRILPWMRGTERERLPFARWAEARPAAAVDVRESRRAYRKEVAALAAAHLLRGEEAPETDETAMEMDHRDYFG